jgi:glycosyltransferase involved in cell wall biosynthesis
VADYAAALARALLAGGEVALNPSGPCDIDLCHLGNNSLHRAAYRRLRERGGVAVFHDAVLHHFYLGSLGETEYVEEFVHNYGRWHREFARQLWDGRARSAQDPVYFEYPMLRRPAEAARAVVVHNAAAAALVKAHAPAARVREIPHLFVAPRRPEAGRVERLRFRLGLRPGTTLFGVFGYLRESKRLFTVLRAFDRVRREEPDVALLVAGEFTSTEFARAVAPHLERTGVLRAGRLAEAGFLLHQAATDVCVNLRHPGAGETSGITIRMMGLGRPVMVTDSAENARFPAGACIRIDPGEAEEEMLAASMLGLARDREGRRRFGRRAAQHIAAEHSAERCARLYWELFGSL